LRFGEQGAAAYTGGMKAGIVITVAVAVVCVLYVTCLAHMADLGSVAPP
jgi:hypothetical protein